MTAPLYLFVGRIASGKETQGRLVAEMLGCEVFTTGAKFREIIASGTALGERIKADYEKGLLMPSWVADYFFEDFVFNLPTEKSAVFEGSGRDLDQAQVVEKVCTWLGRPYTVVHLVVSEEEVIRRALARKRDVLDNDESVVRARLKQYDENTAPAIEYFKNLGRVIEVDGERSVEDIHADIAAKLALK